MDDDSYLLSDLKTLIQDNDSTQREGQPPSLIRGATSLPNEIHERLCKIKRQAPTFTCAAIVTEFLKNWDCRQCTNNLTTQEKSSDLAFTLSSMHLSLKPHATRFPSPHIINTFLISQKSFSALWDSSAHKDEVHAIITAKFCATDNWSWFNCEEHHEEVTNKLSKIFATCLLVKKCHQKNVAFEEVRLKRVRQAEKQTNQDSRMLCNQDFALLYNVNVGAQEPPPGENCAKYLCFVCFGCIDSQIIFNLRSKLFHSSLSVLEHVVLTSLPSALSLYVHTLVLCPLSCIHLTPI